MSCSSRGDKPWNNRTLTRGLELSTYAYPTGREDMVKLGTLFDTPTFEWLDAFEEKKVAYYISMQSVPTRSLEAASKVRAHTHIVHCHQHTPERLT